jgi:hypothetical protein
LGGSSTYFEKRVVDVALHEGWGGGERTEQYEGMATSSSSIAPARQLGLLDRVALLCARQLAL